MTERQVAILVTLIAYKVVLLGLGLIAQRRTRNTADYFLGGRGLGPVVAAVSASASSSSVWTLLGVSGYAFANGLPAVWIFPGCVGGFALNWFVLAPRLRRVSERTGALTVTELLAGPPGRPLRAAINATASAIVLVSLLVYVAFQFQGAGKTFASTFELPATQSIVIGAGIVVVYTLLGGFWAVSLTDTLQGLMMAATAVVLPTLALIAVGGPFELLEQLGAGSEEGTAAAGGLAIGTAIGLLGIGLGYPGQPHVVNRFMALRDERAMTQARRVAMTWALVVYTGMIVLGLCGRVLAADVADSEQLFFVLTDQLCSPIVAGVMLAAVVSAIMSTADSQLLVAAASVSHDLVGPGGEGGRALLRSRLVVLALSTAAAVAAIELDPGIFSGVLFAWNAMGAAFGPLLLVLVWRGAIRPGATLAAMLSGFVLAVVAYETGVGAAIERVVPFAVAFAIAFWGSRPEQSR